MKSTCFILMAILLVGCLGEKQDWPTVSKIQAKLRKQHRESLEKHYGKLRVVATLDTSKILEGEPLWITVDVYADTARAFPKNFDETLQNVLRLSNGAEELEKWPVVFNTCADALPDMERWRSKSFRLQINERFAVKGYGYKDEYVRFQPGSYVGFFDVAPPSNRFDFSVLPVPDSLRSVWNRFATIAAMNQAVRRGKIEQGAVDSARAIAERFFGLPAHYPWRAAGLLKCSQAPGLVLPDLDPQDSLLYAKIITVLAREEQYPADEIPRWIKAQLLKNLDVSQQADALEPLTLQLATPAAAAAARLMADDLRKQHERELSIHGHAGN